MIRWIVTFGSMATEISQQLERQAHASTKNKFSNGFVRRALKLARVAQHAGKRNRERLSGDARWTRTVPGSGHNQYPTAEAATTDVHHQGVQLTESAYQKMRRLSDNYIGMRSNMTGIAAN